MALYRDKAERVARGRVAAKVCVHNKNFVGAWFAMGGTRLV